MELSQGLKNKETGTEQTSPVLTQAHFFSRAKSN